MSKITIHASSGEIEFEGLPDYAVDPLVTALKQYINHIPNMGVLTDPNGALMSLAITANNINADGKALAVLVIYEPTPKPTEG